MLQEEYFVKYNLETNNLCFQKFIPEGDYQNAYKCSEMKKEDFIDADYIKEIEGGLCIPVYEFKIPKLKRCKHGEEPGFFYKNCCPSNEFDTLLFQKYLEYNGLNNFSYYKKFITLNESKRIEVLQKIGYFGTNQKIKTETKQVVVPVDRPLTIEEMGLLDATIYGSFVIVKSLLK